VDNDGVFTDCGKIKEPDCPWKTDRGKHRLCDFHRFRLVASGDKRDQADTTGAFGVGFIAVYQITDRPELISSGCHWIIREDRPESERIEVCSGCSACQKQGLPGTRFILPWASDSNSRLRNLLSAEAIKESDIALLLDDIKRALPTAMLFLRKLRTIEVKKASKQVLRLDRIIDGNSLIVSDGSNNHVWHLLHGNFDREANDIRDRYIGRIESSRYANVSIAVPEDPVIVGLFCAFLPTQQETGLPFHINAEFFTTSDRKRIIFESDYQSEWNRAAITTAAQVFQSGLDHLRTLVSHKRLWEMIESIQKVAQESAKGSRERTLARFWDVLPPTLRNIPVIFTSRGEWRMVSDTLLLLEKEEEIATSILESMGKP